MLQIGSGSRHISQLTRDTVGLILAGGKGTRLSPLTRNRAKPGVPFGGKYRLIDFTLSNCLNSGIRTVGVGTQYLSRLCRRSKVTSSIRQTGTRARPTPCIRTWTLFVIPTVAT